MCTGDVYINIYPIHWPSEGRGGALSKPIVISREGGRGDRRALHYPSCTYGAGSGFLRGDICSSFPVSPERTYLVCLLFHVHIYHFVNIYVFDMNE